MFRLGSRADNLVYRRRTSLEAILYSSVPGNLGPAFLVSSSSDLGVFFGEDDGFKRSRR
jgi:hypothetical protein